eukprot:CAMPEP_0118689328 /NCGR_PEP_ID=MMETSP0800-20121206/9430_1 /TAXON_ID=210618 ORGANISM="Striatella unipunctata, Strain CCMP2910" /NCGR_SAMPLE_ID=MMETSP0800 /ASSEMBLY_ACC=CAM_ASM_000638 /LENGTH=298 /DNA_ID=CAMNT_0006586717 /DNA_START=98 /DNA_END=994 /DNA_ORIENTATION=+
MGDHCLEEQEMEAEALTAIFDTAFEIVSDTQPFVWRVKLLPVDCAGDEEEESRQNHVGVVLQATIPLDYPEESGPQLEIEIIKGLAEEHKKEILELAFNESQANAGIPVLFSVCEVVRSWLADNNVKGLDDFSMHAQMIRRAQETERAKAQAQQEFEAQKEKEELTETEILEAAVQKRRAEGTPCTMENFLAWKQRFEEELALAKADEEAIAESASKKKEKPKEDTSNRITGFQHFMGKTGLLNLAAMEKAAEEAENQEIPADELDVDEELFDDDDDLDDLDFDDEDDDDDDEEEVDI